MTPIEIEIHNTYQELKTEDYDFVDATVEVLNRHEIDFEDANTLNFSDVAVKMLREAGIKRNMVESEKTAGGDALVSFF